MSAPLTRKQDAFSARLARIENGTTWEQVAGAEGTAPTARRPRAKIRNGNFTRRFIGLLVCVLVWLYVFHIVQTQPAVREVIATVLPEEMINPVFKYGGLLFFDFLVIKALIDLRGVGAAPKFVMVATALALNVSAFAPLSITDPQQLWTQHILPAMGGAGALNGFLPSGLNFAL